MATKFLYREEQRFACRDCPARCCRVPWRIEFGADRAKQYLEDEWVTERVGPEGVEVLGKGRLPFRDVGGRLQCVFLDEDELCGLQKKHGHSFLPQACQVFPYGFVRSEKGEAIVALSHLCPSVRDNRGEPIKKQLKGKLKEFGKAEALAERMGSRNGVTLKPRHYMRVIRHWSDALEEAASPAQALADLYDWVDSFEDALPPSSSAIDDGAIDAAMEQAAERPSEELVSRKRSSLQARSLYSYQLGNLCYPSRLRVQHLVGEVPRFVAARSMLNKVAWFLEWGTVDMLLIDQPVSLRKVNQVDRFLGGDLGAEVLAHLQETLERRHLLTQQRYLASVLVDFTMGAAVASRFARCRAAADGRTRVNEEDVKEGRGVADFLLLSHVVAGEQGRLMTSLRQLLLSRRKDYRAILEGEI